jgi:ribonucleoside-diphosphate reductase alpha chain
LLAGNTSSGIEPVFAFSYQRKRRQPDNSYVEEPVEDYAYALWRKLKSDAPPPDHSFVSAQTLTPSDHVAMQAAAQEYIDSSISKTVNCPETISFEDLADIYTRAYHSGCKGATTYRPNSVTGSLLSVAPGEPAAAPQAREPALAARPEALVGTTYKITWPESEHAVYVTINDVDEDGARRPFEIFINSKNMEHYAWTLALTRMISAVFRRGGDVGFVAEELKAVFDPRGGAWLNGRYVPSLLAAIGDVIQRHLDGDALHIGKSEKPAAAVQARPRACPKCAAAALIRAEGCDKCLECGYSKCA